MPCYSPWTQGEGHQAKALSCGQCIGCRLEKSRQWAVRCLHEAQMHEESCFITLTYEKPPQGGSLCYPHFQAFMRKLRYRFRGARIRFFMCGEYGEHLARPHYHACLFGVRFPDQRPAGDKLFTSPVLDELWPHGMSRIGPLSFETAAYVARYVCKKITGDIAAAHYAGRVPEFGQMSRRPGIGSDWIERFWSDVFPRGEVVINGYRASPPRFYLRRFAQRDFGGSARLQMDRRNQTFSKLSDNTNPRLNAKETVAAARLSLSSRVVERGRT